MDTGNSILVHGEFERGKSMADNGGPVRVLLNRWSLGFTSYYNKYLSDFGDQGGQRLFFYRKFALVLTIFFLTRWCYLITAENCIMLICILVNHNL